MSRSSAYENALTWVKHIAVIAGAYYAWNYGRQMVADHFDLILVAAAVIAAITSISGIALGLPNAQRVATVLILTGMGLNAFWVLSRPPRVPDDAVL